jgi:hypothetical protein
MFEKEKSLTVKARQKGGGRRRKRGRGGEGGRERKQLIMPQEHEVHACISS